MSENSLAGFPVLIAAMDLEIKPVLSRMKRVNLSGLEAFKGEFAGKSMIAVISGIGEKPARAAADYVAKMNPSFVLNLGFAGGLKSDLRVDDPFIPAAIRDIKGKSLSCNPGSGMVSNRILLTSESIVRSRDEKKSLSTFADAVDMEAIHLALSLAERGIPFFCVKIISDSSDETLPIDFSPAIRNGKVSAGKVAALMAKNPGKVFPVIRLGFRSKRNSAKLCGIADSFLAGMKL